MANIQIKKSLCLRNDIVKKTIIVLIILLSGALSFYIYSTINEKRSALPLTGEKIPAGDKTEVPAKSSSGYVKESSIPVNEIKEIVEDEEETEKPAEETTHREVPAIKAEDKLKDIPAGEEIKEKGQQPAVVIAEAPPRGGKGKKEGKPVENGMGRSGGQKESLPGEESSERTGKITGVVTAEKEASKPADKPALVPSEAPLSVMKEEKKSPIFGDKIKQPIEAMEAVGGQTQVVEEKTETLPAGGLIIMPIETPAPALREVSSMGTKDIMPEREKEQPPAKMETVVAASHPEKSAETKEGIPAAGRTEEYMEKPGRFPGEMLLKGNNKRVAIYPFENLSDSRDAFKYVLPLLIDKLGKKGFEVVDDDELNSFLCKERVRSSGYVSRELGGKIRKRFNVSAILTGAIVSFSTDEVPQFGVLARMIDPSDGTILWADYSAATGEDFIAILELGRLKTVFSLIPKVVDMLFASLKVEELYREIKPVIRIAVMPFKNNTDFNNAGIIATYMFMVELLKSKVFMPIEYGDIRKMIIELGIRHKGDIGYDNIGGLSKALNARGILVGVVDSYSDGAAVSAAPNVGITARLVNGSNNKIIWYNSSEFSGEENIIALDWGRIRSVHSVAYKAVSSLVKEMNKKKWRD
jgi:TolB-like protein